MTASEKIGELLKYLGLNAKTFAERLGYERPQVIYDILKGKTKRVSSELAHKIISVFPDVNRSWLLADEGVMLKISETEKENLNPVINKRIMDGKSRMIPFYDAETTGGYEGHVSSSTEDVTLRGYINAGDWFDGRETAAIRHVGDSMIEYPDGCVLAVREVHELRLLVPGRNYVIDTAEYRVTKRVQRGSSKDCIALYSTNQEKYDDGRLVYEPFEVELSDIRRIFSVLGYIVNQAGEAKFIKI